MNTKNSKKALLRKFYFTLILSLFLTHIGCTDNPSEFSLGEDFIESKTEITLIDSFSIEVSTVILDTLIGNGSGNALVGSFTDEVMGKITSRSYFQLGIPENADEIETNEGFDSLALIIKYNNYYAGDTTIAQSIYVHQLTENIEYDDSEQELITTRASFEYDNNVIGSINYLPTPNIEEDTLYIKIDDEIGQDLFTKLQEGSDIFTDDETFIDYFHGLILKSDESMDGSIVGFHSHENAISLILYTSIDDITTTNNQYEFGIQEFAKQFNHIDFDLSTTKLNGLIEQRQDLPSSQSNGLAFLQGGIGLAVRVNFPTLADVMMYDRGTIMEAELSISILENSFEEDNLPSQLLVSKTGGLNKVGDYLSDYSGGIVFSSLSVDSQNNEESTYTFDLSKYIVDELEDGFVDPEEGLLISLPPGILEATFSQAVIDAQHSNTNLKLYYVTY